MKIIYTPIGVIRTPFKDRAPRQPGLSDAEGRVEVFPAFAEGLQGMDAFSHVVLVFHLHRSEGYTLLTRTPWDEQVRGVFATRSPRRPNPIGISTVKLERRTGATLHVRCVDMLDKTPLLDIKPYLPSLDA
jgi:tRNA-Thr(GGU) m(6)t(6)A37 methyltransferase TsaA